MAMGVALRGLGGPRTLRCAVIRYTATGRPPLQFAAGAIGDYAVQVARSRFDDLGAAVVLADITAPALVVRVDLERAEQKRLVARGQARLRALAAVGLQRP